MSDIITSAPVLANLGLAATPSMPRAMTIMLGLLTGQMTVCISVNYIVTVAASGYGELTESASFGTVLQVGSTKFKLLENEVAQVRALLSKFPTASSPIGPELAKVASTAALSPLGSESREPPTSAMSDVGVLENCTLARALIANESH